VFTYVANETDRMPPRDPLDEMLVSQSECAKVLDLFLTGLPIEKTSLASVNVVNEHADQAGETCTEIQRADVAWQRVVVNGGHDTRT
tara:strand:+ start:136 stop:396 length:261 start_codon:yes stop_codon:yes gene_type:complete